MARPIFDPRMMARLGDFYPGLCTIQEPAETRDDYGAIVTTWGDFAGHTGLACAMAPNGGQEVKRSDQTYVISNYTISFPSDQSAVTEKMRAVVTGANAGTYEILLVQTGSHAGLTRMLVRKVT